MIFISSETMTSEGLGEMFEDDFAYMCTDKFMLGLIIGQAECREHGSGNFPSFLFDSPPESHAHVRVGLS